MIGINLRVAEDTTVHIIIEIETETDRYEVDMGPASEAEAFGVGYLATCHKATELQGLLLESDDPLKAVEMFLDHNP